MNKINSIPSIIFNVLKSILWFDTVLGSYNNKYSGLRSLEIYSNYFNINDEFSFFQHIMDNIYYHIKDIQGIESVINRAKFEGILKYVKK